MYKTSLKCIIFLLLFPIFCWAQEGVVTGILTTESDGLPLPGGNIIVKGTSRGAQTDFDGKYSIKCSVGEILVISYVGMLDKEIVVTPDMFSDGVPIHKIKRIPVPIVESDAYAKAVDSIKKQEFKVQTIKDAKHKYVKGRKYSIFNGIKALDVSPDSVDITYYKPNIYYQIGVSSNLSVQFVRDKNLPELQTRFSQGATENGMLAFLGPETGTIFSYGPQLNSLEFDGSNYAFDSNGQLVPSEMGNGNPALAYDNRIFNSIVNNFHNVFIDIETTRWTAGVDYSFSTSEDIFGRVQNKKDNLALRFNDFFRGKDNLRWETFVKYSKWVDNQPNINGFTNNLMLNAWTTPVTFDNSQGFVLSNNTQRSYSPSNYNNPEWLFNTNNIQNTSDLFSASLNGDIEITDEFNLEGYVDFKSNSNEQRFGLPSNTVGFEDGYLSHKSIKNNNLNAALNLKYENYLDYSYLEISSINYYRNDALDYDFMESEGFDAFTFNNPSNTNRITNRIDRGVFELYQSVKISHFYHTNIRVSNNIYLSSIQNNKYFLPSYEVGFDLADLLDIYNPWNIDLSTRGAFSVSEMPLFYNNQSHNSLQLLPSESLSYTSNFDLFINDDITLEEKQDFNFNLNLRFEVLDIHFGFIGSYFISKTENSVFPILENDVFQLQNIADIRNNGWDLQLSLGHSTYDFSWDTQLSFLSYRNEVQRLHTEQDRIPIAGFQNISKNLILGEPAGVIVGSAYARDSSNNLIIDANGFPLVDSQLQIIGDPIPKYTLGILNSFQWEKLKLNFTFDYQNGGDVWNGTQNVLNYLGTSQQSANQRGITNFVFNGVDGQGNTNTIPVDFYNPANGIENNRFVRYGFSGVAEDAIEDASYFNLRNIELSYDFSKRRSKFFRQFEVCLYANNLITFTKFRGASPYNSLFDTNSGNNLNFFNTPLITEVGCKVNLKF